MSKGPKRTTARFEQLVIFYGDDTPWLTFTRLPDGCLDIAVTEPEDVPNRTLDWDDVAALRTFLEEFDLETES